MDSPRTWHVIFTGVCYVLSAVIGAVVTYFLTVHFTSKQNDQEIATLERKLSRAESSVPPQWESPVPGQPSFAEERTSFQKKISELQAALAAEHREKEEAEQQVTGLETKRAAQKEKTNKLWTLDAD